MKEQNLVIFHLRVPKSDQRRSPFVSRRECLDKNCFQTRTVTGTFSGSDKYLPKERGVVRDLETFGFGRNRGLSALEHYGSEVIDFETVGFGNHRIWGITTWKLSILEHQNLGIVGLAVLRLGNHRLLGVMTM